MKPYNKIRIYSSLFEEKYGIGIEEFKQIYSEFLDRTVLTKYVNPLILLSNLNERE
ncbi:hypothetical protein RBU61_19075 [Tissierella sp. MB52-C2]|uniref:hypothetical protein n=1 Tax=Tissierella sp. MB52-C2 TaxID=3070999 RepID=UPI00280B1D94|nr:hypothetical protein [Tissierella sp. MB52-C2]WMM25005.1 hypothetical protein RBU61_19075 [Tissierella sp. MB52-C2]